MNLDYGPPNVIFTRDRRLCYRQARLSVFRLTTLRFRAPRGRNLAKSFPRKVCDGEVFIVTRVCARTLNRLTRVYALCKS